MKKSMMSFKFITMNLNHNKRKTLHHKIQSRFNANERVLNIVGKIKTNNYEYWDICY